MKRSNEENARREALARDIMRVYKRVRDDETRLRSPQSIMPTIVAILRSGVTADAPADTNALRMSPAQQWLIGIAWILRELGQVSAFILEMRLTRRPGSSEASYEQIAADLAARGLVSTAHGVPVSREAVRVLYQSARDTLIHLLEKRGLTPDFSSAMPRPRPLISTSHPRLPLLLQRMSVGDAIRTLRRVTLRRTGARPRAPLGSIAPKKKTPPGFARVHRAVPHTHTRR